MAGRMWLPKQSTCSEWMNMEMDEWVWLWHRQALKVSWRRMHWVLLRNGFLASSFSHSFKSWGWLKPGALDPLSEWGSCMDQSRYEWGKPFTVYPNRQSGSLEAVCRPQAERQPAVCLAQWQHWGWGSGGTNIYWAPTMLQVLYVLLLKSYANPLR